MIGKPSSVGRRDSSRAGWLLGLIFVCLAAGIVTIGTFYYRHYEKNYRAQVERQLSAIADLKVGELVQWRKERLANGAVFFKNSSFSGLVRQFFEKPEDAQAQQQIQAWIGKYLDHNQYDEVRLQDAQGVTRLLSPAGLQVISTSIAESISEVLRSGQVTFVDFYRSKQDQRVHLGVLVPIFDEQDASRPLGVIFLRIDPEIYLYPFIQRWPTSSLTAETLLVRREGNEVVFLNELRFQKDAALTLRRPLDQEALPAALAASGQEGVMEGHDYRGATVVAALRAIPDSPWSLVARMDAAEVYAPLREQLRLVAMLVCALLLGAGAGVGLVWRHQRVRFYRTKYEAEEARAKLAAIVESSEDAIIGKSLDGTITSWNAGAERLFGYQAAEIIGQPVTRLIPPESQPWEAEILKRLHRGARVEHYDTVRIAKDGRRIAVSLTISPVRDAAGAIIGAAKIVRDITERKKAETTLAATQRLYQELFDNVGVGLLRTTPGPEGAFIDVNPAMVKMFEADSREQLMAVHPSEIYLDPSQRRIVSDAIVAQGFIKGEEVRFKTLKGRPIWCRISGVRKTDANGQVFFDNTIEDITERKRTEAALIISEVRYRRLFEAARDGILIIDAVTGMIVDVNPFLIDMLGYTHEQFLGKRIWEVGLFKDIVANQDNFAELQQKEFIHYEDKPLETAAGRRIEVEFVSYVYQVDHHKVIQCNIRDITERKRAEKALQESEARFVQFMRNLPALTFIKDGERRIVFVNERVGQVFGLTAADCLGKVSEDLWPGPLGQEIREEDERVLGNGEVMTVDQEIPTREGLRMFRAIKFLIPRVQLPPLLGDISLDVTEILQAEEKVRQLNAELEQRVRERTAELEAANKELEAFSYSVSHDLRAPLRAMDGFSMALLEDCAGKLDETAQDHLRRIRAGSQQMAELIDDLLNLSQVTRTEMRRESVDLTAMAEEIGAEFQRAHPHRKVKSVVAPALAADADARMLRMVLNNLLDNAWKFTGGCAQACIEVGARGQDGQRVFFVRDNGAGFDMAYAGRLFGAFQRLHSTQEFAGTGIGLAIVQRIIHRHGGRVWAEGVVGQGATIYFTLSPKAVRLETVRLKAEGESHA